jgi:hypothetical protein
VDEGAARQGTGSRRKRASASNRRARRAGRRALSVWQVPELAPLIPASVLSSPVMFIEDEHFITSSKVLFRSRTALGQRFAAVDAEIQRAVASLTDDEALGVDEHVWAAHMSGEFAVKAPKMDTDAAEVEHLGRVDVDCTNAPGISRSFSELQAIRPGHRFRILVPVSGESELLVANPSAGAEHLRADFADGYIVRSWDWPEVAGTESFDRSVQAFKQFLAIGAERIEQDVAAFNESIGGRALDGLSRRRKAILAERDFLGSLSVPVKPAPDAPRVLPPIRGRTSPARSLDSRPSGAPPGQGPDMAEFYEHILELIRAVGRGMERSPGSFENADEGTLRDHMLVTLNTHYLGRTYAEAFNRSGKTDILIRIHDRNAFIGECKWWKGSAKFHEAVVQLFGYTTWRDSRLALIFYVKEKNLTSIVEKARAELQGRPEFVSWEQSPPDGEFRCRVRWPDDPDRQATLTVLFFHIG